MDYNNHWLLQTGLCFQQYSVSIFKGEEESVKQEITCQNRELEGETRIVKKTECCRFCFVTAFGFWLSHLVLWIFNFGLFVLHLLFMDF